MSTEVSPRVYVAIAAVTADIGREGISKDRQNVEQRYKFRGIDDVYNALSPIIARHNLCILPRVLGREVTERRTAKGNPIFSVTVEVEFDFVSSEDGSKHTVKTYGEAMDTADKATNKAMSAAYKYAAMQAFCIPTEGDNDADATTHELAPSADTFPGDRPASSTRRPKAGSRDLYKEMQAELDECRSTDDLAALWVSRSFQAELKTLPADWQEWLTARKENLKAGMTERPANGHFTVPPDFSRMEMEKGDA